MRNQNIHIEPIGDHMPHNTKDIYCDCNPVLEAQPEGALLVIHNAWDSREAHETDNERQVN